MSYKPIINLYDPNIKYRDVYVLNYFDILVFFIVVDVGVETVKVSELATYIYKNGISLYSDLRLSKNPYFRKKLEVVGEDDVLFIPVEFDNRIYQEALLSGKEEACTGIFEAVKLKQYRGVWFTLEIKEKEIIC